MSTFSRSRITIACLFISLISFSAFGVGGVNITVKNDTTSTVLVTVYDLNAGRQAVLSSEEINSFATINIAISADQTGHGRVAWTAVNTDRDNRRCGHREKRGLNDGYTLHVFADSECSAN